MNHQIKSKERVAAHGEVFTSEREVNAMLDLVKQETERIDSSFLEPACGDILRQLLFYFVFFSTCKLPGSLQSQNMLREHYVYKA